MPILAQILRRALHISAFALAIGILISCATKKEKNSRSASVTAAVKKKKDASTPTPPPTPAPAPAPQARYTASVKVDGVEVPQNQVPASGAQATPSPSPSASPIPKASPAPTPKPASPNFITGTWRKIFPPKPTPAPTPGETGAVSIRVSTSEGGQTEQVIHEGSAGPSAAPPAPTPIQMKMRPAEGYLMRMWHRIFPKKQEPPAAATPQWVGTIKLVNERDNYALIDSPTSYSTIPVGETLNSVGTDTESGVLRVTADRNSPFFIADIVSGKPRAGDRVYSPKP